VDEGCGIGQTGHGMKRGVPRKEHFTGHQHVSLGEEREKLLSSG
jgi:hypothetical protein